MLALTVEVFTCPSGAFSFEQVISVERGSEERDLGRVPELQDLRLRADAFHGAP